MDPICNVAVNDDLANSQCEFNKKCRRISIKNMPPGINNQDISDLLKPYHYQQIHIDKLSLSCKAVLLDGESAYRCMKDLHLKSFRGSQLIVALASCDFMLCVTQLPSLYTREQFLTLITPFGTPERCFLVHSEVNGVSKGYGCVEFTSKESSIKAKNHLNGKSIGPHTLQVHWLDTIPQAYSGLHSSCLLVENLPISLKDSNKLRDLFSNENIKPKFCQTANFSENDFSIVEYSNPSHAEVLWRTMNNHRIGSNVLRVSFCVPGPCGLVVLNSLKASRDLKRNNPSGGLLPTPMQKLDILPHQHKSSVNTQIPTTLQSAINGNLVHAAANHNDPEVQRLLKALHVRLLNVPNSDCQQQTAMMPNSVIATDPALQAGMMHRQIIQPTRPFHAETQSQFNQGFEGSVCQQPPPGHLMPMQVRGRSASYDSGVHAATDDEVFSSGSSSQEDVGQFQENAEQQHPNNVPYFLNGKWVKSDSRFKVDHNSAFCHRPTKIDMNQPLIPYHQPSIVACQREELQRSDSSDSSYGGSQESTSSVPEVSNSHVPISEMQHYLFTTVPQRGSAYHVGIKDSVPSSNKQNGILGECPGQPMQIGTEFSQPITSLPLSSFGTKAKLAQEHSMICQNEKESSVTSSKQGSIQTTFPHYQRPLPRRAGIYASDKIEKININGIPRPEFLFSSLSSRDETQKHKVQSMNGSNPAFTQHRSRLSTTPIQDLSSPFNRKTSFSSLIADLHDIGADSPTQLQLLGSSLMEGLLGDSPRSGADTLADSTNGSSGAGRLLRALNLFSPTECLSSPHTPIMGRKRGCGMLPSPEPSPEAGAYVGQHSQGLGGHYADQILSNLNAHKRRRSNET